MGSGTVDEATRRRLSADCSRCVALCCVGPGFTASSEFAITKPGGHPCPHLETDLRCGIHDQLRPRGFSGCVGYDCFGAGQRVTQDLFGGRDWRASPETAAAMFGALGVLRQLHELLWYLAEAAARTPGDGDPVTLDDEAGTLARQLAACRAQVEALAALPEPQLRRVDVAAHRDAVGALLRRVSSRVRAAGPADRTGAESSGAERAGADLSGAALAGADLRAASLRGARLIGADLRRADLRRADLLGADLRGADLSGADLRGALFLLASQLESASGDAGTRLPPGLAAPGHWLGHAN